MGAVQMKPDGFFHTTGNEIMRRQIWSGNVSLATSASGVLIQNNGGYARVFCEVFFQASHGSNGHIYRLFEISRYGLDTFVSDGSFTGSIARSGSNTNNVNGLQITNTHTNSVAYKCHVNVYYYNTETSSEVSSPMGLTLIGKGV